MLGQSCFPADARSMQNNTLCLASFFKKVFVKQACNNSYRRSEGTRPLFAYSSFSDCLTSYYFFGRQNRMQGFMKDLKFKLNNKNSVVHSIYPAVECEA